MTVEKERVFLIGVGGMGMAPLAIYLQESGLSVIGYDDNLRPAIRNLLVRNGVEIVEEREVPGRISKVVFSSAISREHSLFRESERKGLPLMRRGEMLASLLSENKLLAVVGSHGKTTTTGMLIHILEESGFPVGYLFGGLYADEENLPARFRAVEWMVAEVDESDGTIELFNPEITLVLNLDWDHTDYYATEEDLDSAIGRLFRRTRSSILLPAGDGKLKRLAQAAGCETIEFGRGGEFDLREIRNEGEYEVLSLDGHYKVKELKVRSFCEFNANNAAAGLAAAHLLCGNPTIDCLENFPGIRRRQALLYNSPFLTVIEDYAHHPVEISELLKCLRKRYPDRKMITVFQPHRYSRTLTFKSAFAEVFREVDMLYLLEVYAASEPERSGGTSTDILSLIDEAPPAKLLRTRGELALNLRESAGNSDLIVFVGAGDIDQWAAGYVKRLSAADTVLVPPKKEFVNGSAQKGASGPLWWEKLAPGLSPDTKLVRDASLADKTTLRVGGRADYYAEPASEADLGLLLKSARAEGVAVFLLGRGSNLIVSEEGFAGMVIRLKHKCWKKIKRLDEGRLWASAGARLNQVCGEACRFGLSGFEFMEGIPGSVGGSLRMNAGAMGGWMFDVVEEVRYMSLEGEPRIKNGADFHVGYRDCRELDEAVALGAIFRASSESTEGEIREKIASFSKNRKETQPRGASAGCIFKNPENGYAGQLIDELGLKGRRVGGAQVSTIHGNFIVNCGGATSSDVLNLIREVRREIKERRGVELEPEVLLLGRSWNEVL